MGWMKYNGGVLKRNGAIALSEECCCGGCCPLNLSVDDVLIAEIIALSGPHVECWDVGDTVEMVNNAAIWQSTECLNSLSMGLELACVDDDHLGLAWNTSLDPGCNATPSTPSNFYQISGSCDPFVFVFAVDLVDDASIACDEGTITIRITKKFP